MKDRSLLMDIIAVVILMAVLFFLVKGLPALMGGAHDATGAPITFSYIQTLDTV